MSVQDEPQNLPSRQASSHEVAGLGLALSIAGCYFMLGSLGLLPMPDAAGPAFVVFAPGLAFLFAGLVCFIRARSGMTGSQTELPEGTPAWIRLSYPMLAIGIFGAFATIGTWVAIGSGPRDFPMAAPLRIVQAATGNPGPAGFVRGAA